MVSSDQLSCAARCLGSGFSFFLLLLLNHFILIFLSVISPPTSRALLQSMPTSWASSSLFFHRIIMFKIMNTVGGASKQEEGSLCRLGYSVAAAHLPSLPLFSRHNEPRDFKAGTERGRRRGRRREEGSVGGRLDSIRGEEGAGETAETAKKEKERKKEKSCFRSDVRRHYRGLLISKLYGHPTETHLHFVLQQLNQYSAHGVEGGKKIAHSHAAKYKT